MPVPAPRPASPCGSRCRCAGTRRPGSSSTVATGAVCLGLALGLLDRPLGLRSRALLAAAVGAVVAQAAIWTAMTFWTAGVNYQHIHRQDGFIVAGCGLLAVLGAVGRPDLPRSPARRWRSRLQVAAPLVVVALLITAAAVQWPTSQRVPAQLSAEQVPAPRGADAAIAVRDIGPRSDLIARLSVTASDRFGHPVPIRFRVVPGPAAGGGATVLLTLTPSARAHLCAARPGGNPGGSGGPASGAGGQAGRPATGAGGRAGGPGGGPIKLTVRQQPQGFLVQAVLAEGACRS